MLAATYRRNGPPLETIELVDIDPGHPGPGEALVEVEAAPVHIADLLYIEGRLDLAPPPPAIAGIEGVGRVLAIGPDVTELDAGQRVLLPRRSGTFAQQMRVNAEQLIPIGDHGDPVQLSLVPINVATSYLLLTGVVSLEAGEWFIQNAANSSCGRFNIGIAKRLGLRSVNVVRRESLFAELTELGGDVVLLDGEDLAARITAATGGAAIRYAIDAIAGDAVTRLAHCLANNGVIANYGLLSGQPCTIPAELLFLHNLRLQGFLTPFYEAHLTRTDRIAMMQRLAGWVAAGELHARIAATYPLRDIVKALEHEMQTGAARDGKVIVLPNA
jgi:trans-2-enoyl-CoA reductase